MQGEGDVDIAGFLAPPRALVLSGGIGHDFEQGCAELARLLDESGVEVDLIEDPAALSMLDHDVLVVDALWWTMQASRYEAVRSEWARSIDHVARSAVERHVDGGGAILALHTAVICFDDWPQWGEFIGARWDWDRSSHPPIDERPVTVAVHPARHRIVDGLADFEVVDEVYGFLDLADDLVPLATSAHGGVGHPLVWTRGLPSGSRVVVDLLGHDMRSMTHPVHRELLTRSIDWLVEVR